MTGLHQNRCDWVRAGDPEPTKLDPGLGPVPDVDVGVAGNATLAMGPENMLDAGEIRLGVDHNASGVLLNTGGRIDTPRMMVGYAGTGVYRQHGGQLNVGQLQLGVQPQSQGQMSLDAGTIEITSPGGSVQVGGQGSGKLYVGSLESPGTSMPTRCSMCPLSCARPAMLTGWSKDGASSAPAER